jgi:nitrite reductase (NADH) small subunit
MTTTTAYNLGPITQIPLGEGRVFTLGEQRIAVFRTRSDEVYATQAECPHRGGPLADGILGGTTLICPLHGRRYDLRTGAVLHGECPLRVYSVLVHDDGSLMLSVDDV